MPWLKPTTMINISIDLSKVDKSQIKEVNGKKYLNVTVDAKKEKDNYGNTHSVYLTQSKEDRSAKANKMYVGSGKEYVFNQQQAPAQQQPAQQYQQPSYGTAPAGKSEPVDNLPF